MRSWMLLGALGLLACGPAPVAQSPAPAQAIAGAPLAATPAEPEAWRTSLDRDHPLVGKIWDVKSGAFIDATALSRQLAKVELVLLGERHDNPDHHRLQARVLTELIKAGRKPAVVLEMLELGQQAAVDHYLAQSDASAAGFGAALGWEQTSWPAFSEYQPIFEAAFTTKLPILAGNIAQADAKALVRQGTSALSPERVAQLRLAQPFPAALDAALLDELRASHCGKLPAALLAPMALAQHARDAQMARSLEDGSAKTKDGAVLIAGGGHARLDRGVPYYLALDAPKIVVVSVLFREVRHESRDVHEYLSDEGPFDFVWFTPRGSDDDPCASFHE
jgi:uncharacterized iron-regulated protein